MSLKLITWNVEHGSASYIQTPSGTHVVVDLGAATVGDANFSPLQYLKRAWGVSQLDLVVITHPHLDHIEDILNFDDLNPRILVRPRHLTAEDVWGGNRQATPGTQSVIRKYLEINERYSGPINPLDDPSAPANNGGVSFQYFTSHQCPTANLNNHSVVTVVSYGGVKFLLTGDNEAVSWDELLQRRDFAEAIQGVHVLVAPHHGRASGFHSDLFSYFNPLLTIISDGRFLDTSATSRYSAVTTGCTVRRRNGPSLVRKCVSTRNDGVIHVEVSNASSSGPRLDVTVN